MKTLATVLIIGVLAGAAARIGVFAVWWIAEPEEASAVTIVLKEVPGELSSAIKTLLHPHRGEQEP